MLTHGELGKYTNSSLAIKRAGTLVVERGSVTSAHARRAHDNCKFAIVFGKRESLHFTTLFGYPVVTLRSWTWAASRTVYGLAIGLGALPALGVGILLQRAQSPDGTQSMWWTLAAFVYAWTASSRLIMATYATLRTEHAEWAAAIICTLDTLVCLFLIYAYLRRPISTAVWRFAAFLLGTASLFGFSLGFFVGPFFLVLHALLAPQPEK